MTSDHDPKLWSTSVLIDMLRRLGVINSEQWVDAHGLKWTLLGKPEWAKRYGVQ